MNNSAREDRRRLPFAEKLKILDKLRERSRAFAEARKQVAAAQKQQK